MNFNGSGLTFPWPQETGYPNNFLVPVVLFGSFALLGMQALFSLVGYPWWPSLNMGMPHRNHTYLRQFLS